MNKKRIGFTLAEVLIALVIMGFIATIGFQVMQIQKTAYTSLAYYAFKDLKSVTSEIMLTEMQGKVPEKQQMTSFFSRSDGGEDSGLHERLFKNDTNLSENDAPANSFCLYMAEMMNTQGTIDCSKTNNFTYYQAMDKTKGLNITTTTTPNFTTTNGMRYYIGKWQKLDDDYEEYNDADDVKKNNSTAYGYRIIAVDLNGAALPNTTKQTGNSLPVDIISFAIVDNGEVLPLGVAANNTSVGNKNYRYLSSKVYGFLYRDVGDSYEKNLPYFCKNTGKENVTRCNYSKEIIGNKYQATDKDGNSTEKNRAIFTFRQAYCNTLQFPAEEIILPNYCTTTIIENRSTRCPCGNTQDEDGNDIEPTCPEPAAGTILYDICKQEVIKPMFRFNFK